MVTDSSWLYFLCNLCCFQFDLSVTNDYELVLIVYEYYDHVFNKVLPLRLDKYIIDPHSRAVLSSMIPARSKVRPHLSAPEISSSLTLRSSFIGTNLK